MNESTKRKTLADYAKEEGISEAELKKRLNDHIDQLEREQEMQEERIIEFVKHIPGSGSLEHRLYDEYCKNRRSHLRSEFSFVLGIVLLIFIFVLDLLFPKLLSNVPFDIIGKYAFAVLIAYALFPMFEDHICKF